MEKGKIDLENINLEDLKEEYKILALENDALRQLAESYKEENERLSAENAKLKNDLKSVKSSKDFYLEQYESYYKKISELKGTLLSIAKLAQSDLQ